MSDKEDNYIDYLDELDGILHRTNKINFKLGVTQKLLPPGGPPTIEDVPTGEDDFEDPGYDKDGFKRFK